jgi:hypothetical protein
VTVVRASPFDHVSAMTDDRGLFEHAERSTPRREHGYCTDDNARMLVVTSREDDEGEPAHLSRVALAFTLAAQSANGRVHNRMDSSGRWIDRATADDCWGRSIWGLGVAATQHDSPVVRRAALAGFRRAARQRSASPRAMAFAALGAADVLTVHGDGDGVRGLLRAAMSTIGSPQAESWAWPEPRLTYANAALAEATIAGGAALADQAVFERGLAMLGWLLDRETAQGHLSVTGAGGRGRAESAVQFDQQPIEVGAMADACWRAHALTGDTRWAHGVALAAAWFDGANDSGAVMWDPTTGGGLDGLRHDGVNLNQGAESTLAFVSTLQRFRMLAQAPS